MSVQHDTLTPPMHLRVPGPAQAAAGLARHCPHWVIAWDNGPQARTVMRPRLGMPPIILAWQPGAGRPP